MRFMTDTYVYFFHSFNLYSIVLFFDFFFFFLVFSFFSFFFFLIFFFFFFFFFFQAEDGIRDADVTGVQTCALPISFSSRSFYDWFQIKSSCCFCICNERECNPLPSLRKGSRCKTP